MFSTLKLPQVAPAQISHVATLTFALIRSSLRFLAFPKPHTILSRLCYAVTVNVRGWDAVRSYRPSDGVRRFKIWWRNKVRLPSIQFETLPEFVVLSEEESDQESDQESVEDSE